MKKRISTVAIKAILVLSVLSVFFSTIPVAAAGTIQNVVIIVKSNCVSENAPTDTSVSFNYQRELGETQQLCWEVWLWENDPWPNPDDFMSVRSGKFPAGGVATVQHASVNFATFDACAWIKDEPDSCIEVFAKIIVDGQSLNTQVKKICCAYCKPPKTVESCDATGATKNIFQPDDEVWVKGNGYGKNELYDLYIVNDTEWRDGKRIPTRVPGTGKWVDTDPHGYIACGGNRYVLRWDDAVVGKYDIVVDVNRDGYYNVNTDALDDMDVKDAGFETIPEFSTIAIPVVAIMGLLFLFSRKRKKEKMNENKEI